MLRWAEQRLPASANPHLKCGDCCRGSKVRRPAPPAPPQLTLPVLALTAQLLNLQKSAGEIPSTGTLRLVRWRIGDWTLDGITPGEWREVAPPR